MLALKWLLVQKYPLIARHTSPCTNFKHKSCFQHGPHTESLTLGHVPLNPSFNFPQSDLDVMPLSPFYQDKIDRWLDEHTGSTVAHSMSQLQLPGDEQLHCCPMITSSNGTFSALLALCAGNSPVTDDFLQRPVMRSFDVFFDLLLNKRLSKQSKRHLFKTPSRSLWRPCNVIICLIFHFSNRKRSQRTITCGQSWLHQGYARTGVPYIGATVFLDGVCQKSGWTYYCGMWTDSKSKSYDIEHSNGAIMFLVPIRCAHRYRQHV